MPRNPIKEKALPVGIFIILSTLLIIGGLIWLRGLTNQPAYTFAIRYEDPAPIGVGAAVFYRGVQVGRLTRVSLAPDGGSTLVQVGITMEKPRLPVTVEPHIRLEGITGARYVELRPPKGPLSPDVDYIAHGEVVEGAATATLDKLQEQLARIADNRTLEKILTKTEVAVSKMSTVATQVDSLSRQASHFLHQVDGPALATLDQFNASTRQIGPASASVQQFAMEAEQTLPYIAQAAEGFHRETAGTGKAIVAVGNAANRFDATLGTLESELQTSGLISNWAQAGQEVSTGVSAVREAAGQFEQTSGQFGQTLEEVNRQFLQTGLLPNVSSAATEIQTGVRSLLGTPGTIMPPQVPELQELNQALSRLHNTSRTLQQGLDTLQFSSPTQAALQNDMDNLKQLGQLIGQTPRQVTPGMLAGQDVAPVERQLEQLQLFSQMMVAAIERMESPFSKQPIGSPERQLLKEMQQLTETGKRITHEVNDIKPQLPGLIERLPEPRPSLFSVARNTMKDFQSTADRFECTAAKLNHILNQRFLGFKLFFGKPGAGVDCDVLQQPEKTVHR